MARLDDQALLHAATRALDELTPRDRDTLEQVIVENKPIDELARASLISIERASFWVDGARTQFRDKLRAQLDRLGAAELAPPEMLDLLAKALRQTRRPVVEQAAIAVRCPQCGAGFGDPRGQFATYAKLAEEGRLGLMIGCTTCSLLFVP